MTVNSFVQIRATKLTCSPHVKKTDFITKSSRSYYETLAKLTEFVKDVARSIRGPRVESRILKLKAHVRTLKF